MPTVCDVSRHHALKSERSSFGRNPLDLDARHAKQIFLNPLFSLSRTSQPTLLLRRQNQINIAGNFATVRRVRKSISIFLNQINHSLSSITQQIPFFFQLLQFYSSTASFLYKENIINWKNLERLLCSSLCVWALQYVVLPLCGLSQCKFLYCCVQKMLRSVIRCDRGRLDSDSCSKDLRLDSASGSGTL